MPSNTFLNLAKDKKIKFTKASLVEFSNHSLKEASINRIVKSCGIARGSFYQYFKDIYDLYNYILEVSKEKIVFTFTTSIKQTKDIRKTFINCYDALISYGTKKSNNKYFKNIFSDTTLLSIKNEFINHKQEIIGKIITNIDKEQINRVGKDRFIFIIELLYIITYNYAIEVFIYNKNRKQIREEYIKQIEFITKDMYNTL